MFKELLLRFLIGGGIVSGFTAVIRRALPTHGEAPTISAAAWKAVR